MYNFIFLCLQEALFWCFISNDYINVLLIVVIWGNIEKNKKIDFMFRIDKKKGSHV